MLAYYVVVYSEAYSHYYDDPKWFKFYKEKFYNERTKLIELCGGSSFPVLVSPYETIQVFKASSKHDALRQRYEAYGGTEMLKISVGEESEMTVCFGPFTDNFSIEAYARKEDMECFDRLYK